MKKLMGSVTSKELFKFNLQLLEGEGDGAGDGAGGGEGSGGAGDGGQDKTFSQADVNALVARESKASQTKLFKELGITDIKNHQDGMAKFHEWQKSQKTDAELLQDQIKNSETTLSEKDAIIKGYQDKEIITSLGVKSELSAKVLKLAELEEGDDLKAKVEKVLAEFPMFKNESTPEVPGQFGTGTKGGGSSAKPGSPDKDAIAKAMGTFKPAK